MSSRVWVGVGRTDGVALSLYAYVFCSRENDDRIYIDRHICNRHSSTRRSTARRHTHPIRTRNCSAYSLITCERAMENTNILENRVSHHRKPNVRKKK